MLTNSFCHLKGIGKRAEEMLWFRGILSWADLERHSGRIFSEKKQLVVLAEIRESREALMSRNVDQFIQRLPVRDQVRVLPHFRSEIAYIDIETTGLGPADEVTMVSIYNGSTVRTYVQGRDLQDFVRDSASYRLLITYNGTNFDLPFLRGLFGDRFKQAHLDLCPVLSALGFRGGLKTCERVLGVRRRRQDEIDGREAVRLWRAFREGGDDHALRILWAYNVQDVLSLETLLVKAYNLSMKLCPAARPISVPRQSSAFCCSVNSQYWAADGSKPQDIGGA